MLLLAGRRAAQNLMPEDEEEEDDEETPSALQFSTGCQKFMDEDHILSVAPTDELREHRRYVLNMPSKAGGVGTQRPP